MWSQVQKLIHHPAEGAGGELARKPSMKLNNLGPGSVINFARACPLPQLSGKKATITQVRTYRFGQDINISYAMRADGVDGFSLTVAEDAEGYYLALSRELSEKEQDIWFGRDALSFFTEESTAKTIRCKADMGIEGDWASGRYSKSVDWVEGSVLLGRMSTASTGRQVKQFHYNLLVNETGDRALEIEHEDATGENRIMVTVYRPVEDIASIAEPMPHVPVPDAPLRHVAPAPMLAPTSVTQEEPPLFTESTKPRTDFRRLNGTHNGEQEEIRVARELKPQPAMEAIIEAGMPPLPSFLVARENNYLSLDEVIPPDTDRVRCDLRSAKAMIDMALTRGVRVRDIMREIVGLDSMLNDEVIFEMPLSDADYRALAMRYKLRPDRRDEIRERLQQELSERLIGVAKR